MTDEEPQLGVGPAPKPEDGAARQLIDAHLEARRITVERLELQGLSQRAIADAVRVDVATVNRDLKVIRANRREAFGESTVLEQRDVTLARLEGERARVLSNMADDPGDPTATPPRPARPAKLTVWQGERLLLQIEKQRAELLGLNVPQRVHLAEIPPGDPSADGLEEAEKPRTLADLLGGNTEAAGALAEVIHMATRRGA